MDDAPSYLPPIALGAPVRATTIGQVAESRSPAFPVGSWASGLNGIEDYSLCAAGGFTALVDPDAVPSVTNYLSAVGAIGLTAYFAPARRRAAAGGRDGARLGRGGCGRIAGRADRQDEGLPHHRHRRRRGEMRAAGGAVRL
jgi:hypothetical protein